MPGVDTSMYDTLGKGPEPMNMLEMVGRFAQTQNMLNENKLFGIKIQSNKAVTEAMQKSIDPATGQPDYGKAATFISTDPRVYDASDIINGWVQREQTQALTVQTALKNAADQQSAYGAAATSLLPLGEKVTKGDITKKIGELYANKMITKDNAIAYLAALPDSGPALNQHLKELALRSMATKDALDQVYGNVTFQDAGGTVAGVATSPMFGSMRSIGSIEKTLTPEQLNNLVVHQDAKGNQLLTPRFKYPVVGGAGTPMNQGAAGDGSSLPSGAPGQPGGSSGSPADSPIVQNNPSLTAYKTGAGGKVADAEAALNDNVENSNKLLFNMGLARDAMKDFKAGGGAESFLKMSNVAAALGMQDLADRLNGGGPGARAAAQEFQKATAGVVLNQMKAIFSGLGQMATYEFQAMEKNNPNLETDPKAIEKMFDLLQRQVQLVQAKQQGLNRWKQSGKPLDEFEANWQKYLQRSGKVPQGFKASP